MITLTAEVYTVDDDGNNDVQPLLHDGRPGLIAAGYDDVSGQLQLLTGVSRQLAEELIADVCGDTGIASITFTTTKEA